LILTGKLPGGERLNQDELASRLGVSRMPIRQAIRRLESDGLVVSRPNRGAVVTALGPEAILELFEMRSVLEGLALRIAVTRMTPADLKSIEESVAALERTKLQAARWFALHDALHDFLCSLSGRPKLAGQAAQLRVAVTPYIRLYVSTHSSAEMPGFEHLELLDIIRKGKPAACEAAMREHVMSAAAGVVEFVKASTVPEPEHVSRKPPQRKDQRTPAPGSASVQGRR
jgi:DNA-binding GntR family transcriptional regulator